MTGINGDYGKNFNRNNNIYGNTNNAQNNNKVNRANAKEPIGFTNNVENKELGRDLLSDSSAIYGQAFVLSGAGKTQKMFNAALDGLYAENPKLAKYLNREDLATLSAAKVTAMNERYGLLAEADA